MTSEPLSAEFRTRLLTLQREVNAIVVDGGAGSRVDGTRIGGAPWWPRNQDRPRCRACSRSLAFMAQIALRDVPLLADHPGLLSFHYCQHCTYEGSMSFGGENLERHGGLYGGLGYEVTVFRESTALPDDRGVLEASPIPPSLDCPGAQARGS